MSYDDAGHEGLVARLLKFEDGARQRCTVVDYIDAAVTWSAESHG